MKNINEYPIHFNEEMALAVHNGNKIETRRPLKKQLPPCNHTGDLKVLPTELGINDEGGVYCKVCGNGIVSGGGKSGVSYLVKLPYRVGQTLWVREAYAIAPNALNINNAEQAAIYRAGFGQPKPDKWKPSIHMPRWAARNLLLVTEICFERINAISEEDAIAEGFDNSQTEAAKAVGWYEKARKAFLRTWGSIYGDASIKENHWVAVIKFKRIS